MVHFGKRLVAVQYPAWKDHYIDYNRLKRILENGPEKEEEEDEEEKEEEAAAADEEQEQAEDDPEETTNRLRNIHVSSAFQRQLDAMIEHAALFSLEQQGHIAHQLQSLQQLKSQLWNECQQQKDQQQQQQPQQLIINTDISTRIQNLRQEYRQVAALLLEIVRFTELNLTGIRKILKKHDRLYPSQKLTSHYFSDNILRPWQEDVWDSHLNQFLHQQQGVATIMVTLQHAFVDLERMEQISTMTPAIIDSRQPRRTWTETDLLSTVPIPLIQVDNYNTTTTTTNNNNNNHNTQQQQQPQQHMMLHRQHSRSRTTTDLLELGRQRQQQYHQNHRQYLPHQHRQLVHHEPLLFRIEMARNKLHTSSRFVQMLAAPAAVLLTEEIDNDFDIDGKDERHAMMLAEAAAAAGSVSNQKMSNILNLLSTFLYITNYYIAAPTSGNYAAKLHGSEALAGVVIGMTSFAALAGTLLYSWWTSHSYKAALIFAAGSAILGNVLYALALPYESLMLVLVGRLLIGFGSCRSINRRYIADSYTREDRTAASAAFVTAGSFGMAVGPAVAASLAGLPDGNHWISVENAPGWIMFLSWSVYVVLVLLYFEDPPRQEAVIVMQNSAETNHSTETQRNEAQPLLLSSSKVSGKERIESEEYRPLWSNVPVMTTLFIAFLLKMTLECSLSSTATVTSFYFGWSVSQTGIYLALLGLLMFPANLGISWLSKRFEDRDLIFGALCLMLFGTVGIIEYGNHQRYTQFQYIVFGVIIFVSTNALEGPNMSLLSKTIPRSWARGFFNMGLLVTESGTFGRTVGDGVITWFGLGSIEAMLNHTFAFLSTLVAVTVLTTYCGYNKLKVPDHDDDDVDTSLPLKKPVQIPGSQSKRGKKAGKYSKPSLLSPLSPVGILLVFTFLSSLVSASQLFDFGSDFGGIPDDNSFVTCSNNSAKLRYALNHNISGNILRFAENQTYYFHHGVVAEMNDAVLLIDGILRFERADLDIDKNPHTFPACLTIVNSTNVTVTSTLHSSRGIIDGQGSQWWGVPFIGYLKTVENRPRLLRFNQTRKLLIENIVLKDSAYHTLYLDTIHDTIIRNMSIVARRTNQDGHSWVDLTAFNTDGIDVSGTNVHIHDVDIWTQDDCIAVKDVFHVDEVHASANMTFERINATGLGFVVGSIQGTHVHNITFKNSFLYKPVKGIYVKTTTRNRNMRRHNRTALIEDVKYINITIVAPQQWPIWMGPAQQADNRNICHPNPCSLCWPMYPGSKCNVVPRQKIREISLENVYIYNPVMATGVFLGSDQYPIENITLDNVRVIQGIPPLLARRPIVESFPATQLPVHDPYVPPEYATNIQKRIVGVYGWIVHSIVSVGSFVQRLIEKMHLALVIRVAQTQEVQTWYLSYLTQAFLNTVWVWLAMALGFATAGGFSFRGWMRYRKLQRTRMEEAEAAATAAVDTSNDADERLISPDDSTDREMNHPRIETRWPPLLCHLGYIALLFLCFGGAIYTGTFPFRKPTWRRTYRYYTCKSVINGIAKGNTWPIPQCFKRDHTPWWPGGGGNDNDDNNSPPSGHHHRRHRHGSDHWSPHKVTIDTNRVVTTACLALVILAIALFSHIRQWSRQRRERGQAQQLDREDNNAGVPEYSPIPSFVTIEENGENDAPLTKPLESVEDERSVEHVDYIDPLVPLAAQGSIG